MPIWTKDSALRELTLLVHELNSIVEERAASEAHVRWFLKTERFLTDVFGAESPYLLKLRQLHWTKVGPYMVGGPKFPQESLDPDLGRQRHDHTAYLEAKSSASGILLAAQDELGRSELEHVYRGKDSPAEASLLIDVLNGAQYKLRKLFRSPPSGESEVQDKFEDFLIGASIPYSREAESIEYSAKTYRPDFTIPRADLAVEIKFCGRKERVKELPAEINDDILAYSQQFGNKLFVVYDLGHIRDVERFTSHFEQHDGVIIVVVKQ